MTLPIYLDNAASTPVDPRVAQRMMACLTQPLLQGNPASLTHDYGRQPRELIEQARVVVAQALGATPAEIVFTSGATESDNLALFGVAKFHAPQGEKGRHIISSRTEHKAVLEPLKRLEKHGFKVTYLKPDAMGIVQPEQVRAAITLDTILVSLMHVNNETGVIQDIAAIGAICREHNVLFHVDAAQSAGRLLIDVQAMNVDLLACTAHKIYGPKGIGALYLRRLAGQQIGLEAQIIGGGQEFGARAGTLATHQIVGFGEALRFAMLERDADNQRIAQLRDRLWQGLQALGGVELNGHASQRVSGILNVAFHGVEGESLMFALRDLAISAGAACSTGSDAASYVLRALGRSDQLAQSSLRFSVGRFTTVIEIDSALQLIAREVTRLRATAA